jgi:hypothetical protein
MRRVLLPVVCCAASYIAAGCSSEQRDAPRGWYCAGSKLEDEDAPGGFGPCDNFPKRCANGVPGTAGQLSLIAYPGETVERGKRAWMRLRLVNRTQEMAVFCACDSRLYLVQEALDRRGRWRALERFPETSCGNSFHRVFLGREEYWDLYALPRAGSFKTKLRFRLEPRGEAAIAEGGQAVYSSEFEGSIQPSEFLQD